MALPVTHRHHHRERVAERSVVGGQIGCDYQFANNAVIGIEGTGRRFERPMRGSAFVGLPLACAGDLGPCAGDNDFLTSMTGRIGYAFDTVLIYGRGGFAMAGDKYDVIGGDSAALGHFTFRGLIIASAGSLAAAWIGRSRRHWSMNVEYDYYHFGRSGGILMTDQFTALTGVVDVKQNIQVIKVGLNFHIGASGW